MKIVIINGSARKGNTLAAINAFIKGASEKNKIEIIPLPVCSGHHPGCVFTQQVFRSGWRLECVLGHGSDRRGHFPYHLPQGDCKTCDGGPKGMNAVLLDCAG